MTVFTSHFAGHYDQLYAAKDYRQECDLIEQAISRYGARKPATILDIGCGTGAHALELARRGYAATGVDLSAAMLERAREKGASLPEQQRPRWIEGDVRSFEAGGTFEAAIMMFAVVGYLTTNDDVLAGLRNIRRHLPAGALFACDFWYGPSVLYDRPTDRARIMPIPNGEVIRTTNTRLDIVQHTADVSFRLWTIEHGRVISQTDETHRMRYFFPQEFALMLSQSGFSMLGISAFPTIDAPLTDQSWNAFVVAKAV